MLMTAEKNRRRSCALAAMIVGWCALGPVAATYADAKRPASDVAASWRRSPDGSGYEPRHHYASKAWFLLAAVGFAIVRKVRRG